MGGGPLLDLVKRELLPDEDFKIEYGKVKQQLADRQLELSELPTDNFDVKAATAFVFDFIAELPKSWDKTSYWQKTKLMSLIFHQKPIYNYINFTTPKLSYIYQAKTALAGGENALVGWVGIEPDPLK